MKATQPFYLRLINDISQVEELHYELSFEDADNLRQFEVVVDGKPVFKVKVPILYPQAPPVFRRSDDSVKTVIERWRPWYTIHQSVLHMLGVQRLFEPDEVHQVVQSSSSLVQPEQFSCLAVWSQGASAVLCESFRSSVESASLCEQASREALEALKGCCASPAERSQAAVLADYAEAHRRVISLGAPDLGVSAAMAWVEQGVLHCWHLGAIRVAVVRLRGFFDVAVPHHDSSEPQETARVAQAGASLQKVSPSLAYIEGVSEESRGLGCPLGDPWMLREPSFSSYTLGEQDFAVVLASKGLHRNVPLPELCSLLAPRRSASEAASQLRRICEARHTGHGAAVALMYVK